MAQISRPFQIVVAAFALLVLVWFFALHRPGSGSSSGTSAGSGAPAATHTHATAATAGHTRAAAHPGTGGRVHSTASHTGAGARHKASTATHGRSTAHRPATHRPATHASAPAAAAAGRAASSHAAAHTGRSTPHRQGGSAAPAHSKPATPALQAAVASELTHGKMVLLLFWNRRSSTDGAVYGQVQAVEHKLGRRVAVHTAAAGQVGEFGSITRDIQVYQTPTLLIVNPHRQVSTVTGFTDAYAIEQAIAEARG